MCTVEECETNIHKKRVEQKKYTNYSAVKNEVASERRISERKKNIKN